MAALGRRCEAYLWLCDAPRTFLENNVYIYKILMQLVRQIFMFLLHHVLKYCLVLISSISSAAHHIFKHLFFSSWYSEISYNTLNLISH